MAIFLGAIFLFSLNAFGLGLLPVGSSFPSMTGPIPVRPPVNPSGPIAPGYCPPGVLPQYCRTQMAPATLPYVCPIGSVQCINQRQQSLAYGCAPGPYQYYCLQQRARQAQMLSLFQPPPPKPKPSMMQKILPPLLNAISGMMGGGGGGGPEPADGGRERMAAGWDQYGGGGYSSAGSTTSAGNLNPQSNRGFAPIVPVFQKYFDQCTQSLGLGQCTFRNDGIWPSHQHSAASPNSCHNSGEAIDVGLPFKCSSGAEVKENDPMAMQVAVCMATQTQNQIGVIFKDKRLDPNMFPASQPGNHEHHIHVQIRHCGRGRR